MKDEGILTSWAVAELVLHPSRIIPKSCLKRSYPRCTIASAAEIQSKSRQKSLTTGASVHSGKLKGAIIRTTPTGSFRIVGPKGYQVKLNGAFEGLAQDSTFEYAVIAWNGTR